MFFLLLFVLIGTCLVMAKRGKMNDGIMFICLYWKMISSIDTHTKIKINNGQTVNGVIMMGIEDGRCVVAFPFIQSNLPVYLLATINILIVV